MPYKAKEILRRLERSGFEIRVPVIPVDDATQARMDAVASAWRSKERSK